MQNRSINLSERDLESLLKLLAKGELLGSLHGQLLALLMQRFNLRHIPWRMAHLLRLARRQRKKAICPPNLVRTLALSTSRSRRQLRLFARLNTSHGFSDSANLLLLLASFNGPLLTSFSCILLSIGYNGANRRRMLALSNGDDSLDYDRLSRLRALELYDRQRNAQSALKALQRKFHEVRLV